MWTFYFLLSILFSSYQTTLLQLNKRPVFRSSSDSNNVIEEALGNVLVVRKLVSEQDSQIETLKDEVNSLQSSLENISAEKLCSLYINRTYGLMDDIDFLMKDAEANVTKLEKKNLMLQKAVLSSKEVITFNTVRLAETKQQLKSAELRIDSKDKLILEAIKELEKLKKRENHTRLIIEENVTLTRQNKEKDQQIKDLHKELNRYRMFRTFFIRIVDELKSMNNSELDLADFMRRIKRGAKLPEESLDIVSAPAPDGGTEPDHILVLSPEKTGIKKEAEA